MLRRRGGPCPQKAGLTAQYDLSPAFRSSLVTNWSLGSHRFSQTTTDFDGQRWLSFDSLTLSTPFVALIFLMQERLPSKKKKKNTLTESWWLAGLCRPVLAAIRRHAAAATQDHILLKYPRRSCRLERNMTRSGDSALGTCPATLSHLVGLFEIDVEDISRAATKKKGARLRGSRQENQVLLRWTICWLCMID